MPQPPFHVTASEFTGEVFITDVFYFVGQNVKIFHKPIHLGKKLAHFWVLGCFL